MPAMAILVAAGRGERMGGGRPKAFLDLGGQPLLLRAARAFDEAPSVDRIVAVVPEAQRETAGHILSVLAKPVGIVAGGERRQDSVLEGLKQAPRGFEDVVLVHDAARPLVEVGLIEEVVRVAGAAGAAVPVLPVVDTIKRLEDGRVVETLDRETLGAAQTPQGFLFGLLALAYETAFREHVTLTDEAMAVERMGTAVKAVPGSPRNRKITTPDDLAWAQGLVQGVVRA